MTIRNPAEWGAAHFKSWSHGLAEAGHAIAPPARERAALEPTVRRIRGDDLRDALRKGLHDFMACRTDVLFIALIYPLVGLLLAELLLHGNALHLLFPLASGFVLIGPFAAVGLYEMSRRRERGDPVSWADAFGVARSPAFGAILAMGAILTAVFLLWLVAAQLIYMATLAPLAPEGWSAFVQALFTTRAGWAMIVLGMGVGFLFAVLALAISVVSFPLLMDRRVGVATAIRTSVRATLRNPEPMALWGLIVAGGLLLGSLPAFVGLVIVMPVLGHATWHLYRRLIPE
ncbi:cytochrome C oxidase subunit I (plasmid) [Azospirillum argentinense]|uniref:Cytochrome C oxidase subunit I n=1 Tax=Azospirillum argentinense TaxID=2970906 RepID=A0A060DU44_9PROT|nr:DUF2189 domain-containing protein [Azospirillum argentinense]AIB16302.1 cytochrome C oxidase subunit I [Azospirillum argentinense]EZQ02556.1 cytochrome C oxidase subunit I [Azospirillum argentinense]